MSLVVLVDHDDEARSRFARTLTVAGFDVRVAADGHQGLRIAFEARPDAFVIDLADGRDAGVELVRILRAACDVPIIGMAVHVTSPQVVAALNAGADDVVARDCSTAEVLARVRSAIRRYERHVTRPAAQQQVRTGGLVIDRDAQTVTKDGISVQLSRTEYRLLDALAARLGETSPHRYLLSSVWGEQYVDDTHYLRVYIGYLRAKLEADPATPEYLVNEWGVGYRLARLPVSEREADATAGREPARRVTTV